MTKANPVQANFRVKEMTKEDNLNRWLKDNDGKIVVEDIATFAEMHNGGWETKYIVIYHELDKDGRLIMV